MFTLYWLVVPPWWFVVSDVLLEARFSDDEESQNQPWVRMTSYNPPTHLAPFISRSLLFSVISLLWTLKGNCLITLWSY